MEYVTLGKTGLQASIVGLGGGGPSRLGQKSGNDDAASIAVVHRALELGANFFDTAEAYGTEEIIGKAIRDVPRESVILSTKKGVYQNDTPLSGAEMITGAEACLGRLGVDYVDIFHLHGVKPHQYEHAIQEVVPAMLRLKEQGKIRWLGITESWSQDTKHIALQRALQDDCWDVMMVGFNLMNYSARDLIFPTTIERDIGVLAMFVVRRALSNPLRLQETMTELVISGQLDADAFDADDPLGFLTAGDDVDTLPEAAYRYARHEPGIHVVLSGTGNIAHLEENVAALLRPPLPADKLQRVNNLFAGIDTISAS